MSNQQQVININSADVSTLTKLPGIGPSMAQGIIQHRPYTTVKDLCEVKGIGEKSLESLTEHITVGEITPEEEADPQAEELPDELLEAKNTLEDFPTNEVKGKAEKEETELSAIDEKPPISEEISTSQEFITYEEREEKKEEKEEVSEEDKIEIALEEDIEESTKEAKKLITQSQARWLVLTSSLLSLVLALALTFGILNSLNGGLNYAAQNDAITIKREINSLQGELDTLALDIEGIQERLDNLESVNSQIKKLEGQLTDTKLELEKLQEQVLDAKGERETLSQQLSEVEESSLRFQKFLEELQQLLNGSLKSEDTNDNQ